MFVPTVHYVSRAVGEEVVGTVQAAQRQQMAIARIKSCGPGTGAGRKRKTTMTITITILSGHLPFVFVDQQRGAGRSKGCSGYYYQ